MPLTLLFSAQVTSDEPVEFNTSITTTKELVVDVINLNNLKRRMAGWMYSSIPSGLGDNEFADSKRIVFGKNRVIFTTHRLPFKLKFYPQYGLRNFDLNVYSGSALLEPGTPLRTAFVARVEQKIRGGVLQVRGTNSGTWSNITGPAAIAQAYFRAANNMVMIRTHQGELYSCIAAVWTWTVLDLATFRSYIAEFTTVEIYSIATPQF